MKFSNITDDFFWNKKYAGKKPRYFLFDPFYGRKGLLAKTLLPLIKEAKNILELGCASSRYMMFFNLVAGLNTYGIDFSKEGLYSLQQMAQRHGITHNLYFGNFFELDLEEHKFDIVFHSGLAEHFSELNLLFQRCHFFCKKNGLMIFMVPNMQNRAWSWHKQICPSNYKAHIPYTKENIISSLTPYFSIIEVKSWGYPQLYAGGPPESVLAFIAKNINLGLIFLIHLVLRGYNGEIGKKWASAWLIVCKALHKNNER